MHEQHFFTGESLKANRQISVNTCNSCWILSFIKRRLEKVICQCRDPIRLYALHLSSACILYLEEI